MKEEWSNMALDLSILNATDESWGTFEMEITTTQVLRAIIALQKSFSYLEDGERLSISPKKLQYRHGEYFFQIL